MLIGTAGHIDHGKTSLVKALTGVDADRLPEEKQRGITLDLGYAYSPINEQTVLGFIDVPGHEKLIHTMLAGVTALDFILLVIAADDGPMPQTREHLELIDLLGIQRGAVALSKIDQVDPARLVEVQQQICAFVADSGLKDCPIFPLSSVSGQGIAPLRDYLQQQALNTPNNPAKGRFRLALDRAFTLKGVGTVVTGTAISGEVKIEDQLVISPPGFHARVRGLHVQDRQAERGQAAERCAIALKGEFEKSDLHRGMWLIDPALAKPLTRFQAWIKVPKQQAAVKHLQVVHLHLATDDIVGRVSLLDCKKVEPGEQALVEIQLERATLALNGDRFILRDAGAQRTVAGGQVLDIVPPARYKRTPERLELLRLAQQQDLGVLLHYQANHNPNGVDLNQFGLSWNLDETELSALSQRADLTLIKDAHNRLVLSNQAWLALQTRLLECLAAEHQHAPDMIGVEANRLRRMLSPHLTQTVFERLCTDLIAQQCLSKTRAWLHLPEHRAELNEVDQQAFAELKPLLLTQGFNPPRVRDIAQQSGQAEYEVRRLFKRVARVGELYPVAHDHYFTAGQVAKLADIVRQLNEHPQGATIASLRNYLSDKGGGGRKLAQQILEFFDRVGYTRRHQDAHVLRHQATEHAWVAP
jgi:selenocysteine-specific elongation factor